MSVEMISKRAQDYEYNGNIALRYWLRTAATLIREVRKHACVKADLLTQGRLGTYLRTRRKR